MTSEGGGGEKAAEAVVSSEGQPITGMTTTSVPTPQQQQQEADYEATASSRKTADAEETEERTDEPEATKEEQPAIKITLLLISGQRQVVPINADFLAKNEQSVEDAGQVTIGTLRGSLFNDWQESWGNPPANATNIRLIHLGKILEDDQTLTNCGISHDNPHNVVHMSVKPESFELDSSSKAKATRRPSASHRSDRSRSRCCIIQ
jgi:hypothetical protein